MARVLPILLAAAALVAMASACDDEPEALTAETVLSRAEAALFADGTVPAFRESTIAVTNGVEDGPWFRTDAEFSPGGESARLRVVRPPELALDVFEEAEILVTGGMGYLRYPGEEEVQGLEDVGVVGLCADETDTALRRWLVCGLTLFGPNLEGMLAVTEDVEYNAAPAVAISFAAEHPDVEGTVTRTVFFDAGTWLPLGYIQDFEGGASGNTGQLRADWTVNALPEEAVAADWFDPVAFGYRTEAEQEMETLDSASAGPLFWLGREFELTDGTAMTISWVHVTPLPPPGAERGAWTSVEYGPAGQGNYAHVESWLPGDWESFLELLASYDTTFEPGCFESTTVRAGTNEAEILRFRYGNRLQSGDIGSQNPAGTGCPDRPYDWVTAVVRFEGGTATINAPIGLGSAPSGSNPVNSVEEITALAALVRERQKGE